MVNRIGSLAATKWIQKMTAAAGINSSLAALSLASGLVPALQLQPAQVRSQNVAADLVERGEAVTYPAAHVYCEKISNPMVEKFRRFSGTLQMAVELRHSQDRLPGLADSVELLADAVMNLLDGSRGDWGDGMYYGGGYQVAFGAVKPGGKNYLQTAKITFDIFVSIS